MCKPLVRGVVLSVFCFALSTPGCGSDLERSKVGSACTRDRDCQPTLECTAGECRMPTDAADAHDAASTDAATDTLANSGG